MTRPAATARPPMVDGVSASCVALPAGPWPLLIDFLAETMPGISRETWLARLQQRKVVDEQGNALPADAPYRARGRIYYYRELSQESRIPFEATVLYQDEHLVVADKPHFLPVTPSGRFVQETLLVRLKRQLGLEHLSPIHRIDRETAGLVLLSVHPQERGIYQAVFRNRLVDKRYIAIAPARDVPLLPTVYRSRIEPDLQFFRQREVPGEPDSETRIETLQTSGPLALYQLQPLTGKTHQLRVHMSALGRPIVGDLIYPQVVHGPGEPDLDTSRPLQLLAQSLEFVDPVTGERRCFQSQRRLNWPLVQA
jgi:tRNA pseudouridine32 synthase / 23S rRNA pseudouridine746 synthase